MNKLIMLLAMLFVINYANAQENSYDNDIKHFIEINGTIQQYKTAVSELTDMLKQQYKDANVKDNDWIEIKEVADSSLVGLSNDLVVVYKKFFTHNEIKELNTLYETAVAQKFIGNVINLTNASQDVSIVWSRSLYNQLQDLLHQKGY